jgi:murein DD-endopeptidase MepM/ murein hydrolase activator NlpD
LEKRLPERRIFLRTDDETRYIRLASETQLLVWAIGCLVIAWTIIATAIIVMDSIGAGNFRAQAERDQLIYEDRLNAMSNERDTRAAEASAFQERFSAAMGQISAMQTELLASEAKRRELEAAISTIRASLGRVMEDRETAREELAALRSSLESGEIVTADASPDGEIVDTVDILADALAKTAAERDQMAEDAAYALAQAEELELEMRLMEERNDAIFRQLEEAMLVSVEPLDNMFRAAGMNPDQLIDQVRAGYSGLGGPELMFQMSTRGGEPSPDELRMNTILESMDRINMYRIAADRAPFAMPVFDAYRFTSGFGQRWGRLHAGSDFAAPTGTPVYATADGVITYAGWLSGYGRLIKIRHSFGIETRYAHLNAIRVKVGQRVSRGDRIGDMGNSGRSTGPHLHYEIRVNGNPVNPMTFIRAGRDVF